MHLLRVCRLVLPPVLLLPQRHHLVLGAARAPTAAARTLTPCLLHADAAGGADLPLRLLDGFSVVLITDTTMQARLTDLPTVPGMLVAKGFVLPADGKPAGEAGGREGQCGQGQCRHHHSGV